MGFEPTTLSLARRCSTTEPLPPANGLRPVVPRVGIEPTTRGFSVRCSTAELPRLGHLMVMRPMFSVKINHPKDDRRLIRRSYTRAIRKQTSWRTGVSMLYSPQTLYRFDGRVETVPQRRSLSLVRNFRLITNIYIDGFNLYYRALKDSHLGGFTCISCTKGSFSRTPSTKTAIAEPS